MTRGEGEGQKSQKPAYIIAWMFPNKLHFSCENYSRGISDQIDVTHWAIDF